MSPEALLSLFEAACESSLFFFYLNTKFEEGENLIS